MYHQNKLIKIPEVLDLPACMYKVNPYNKIKICGTTSRKCSNSQDFEDQVPNCMGNDGLEILEKRQEGVLQRLQDLKQRLSTLQDTKSNNATTTHFKTEASPSPLLKLDDAGVVNNAERKAGILQILGSLKSQVYKIGEIQKGTIHDLVISANPSNPPYSLLILRKLLGDLGLSVFSTNQVHSSVDKVDENLKKLFNQVPNENRLANPLAFTVQWKDVDQPTLMVNPCKQILICREVNIVRYICRLFPQSSPIHYEATGSFNDIAKRDVMLDRIQDLLNANSEKNKNAFVQEFNGKLKSSKFLLGHVLDIVDILAWSAVKQNNLQKDCPPKMSKWFLDVQEVAALDKHLITILQLSSNTNREQSLRKKQTQRSQTYKENENRQRNRAASNQSSNKENQLMSDEPVTNNTQASGKKKNRRGKKSQKSANNDQNQINGANKKVNGSTTANNADKNKQNGNTNANSQKKQNGNANDASKKNQSDNANNSSKKKQNGNTNANSHKKQNGNTNDASKKKQNGNDTINQNRQNNQVQSNSNIPKKVYIDRKGLIKYLKQLNIHHQEIQHKRVFTVNAMMDCLAKFPGIAMKNLFLRDKKKHYFLLAIPHDAKVDFFSLALQLGTKDLRLGDERIMFDLLGVEQGSLSVYALINDKENKVKLVLDSRILYKPETYINFHPMTNTATLGITAFDLIKFISSINHEPILVNI